MGERKQNDSRIRDVGERRGPRGDEAGFSHGSEGRRFRAREATRATPTPRPVASAPNPPKAPTRPKARKPPKVRRPSRPKRTGKGLGKGPLGVVLLLFAVIGLPIKCMRMVRKNPDERARPTVQHPDLEALRREMLYREAERPSPPRPTPPSWPPAERLADPHAVVGSVRLLRRGHAPRGVGIRLRQQGGGSMRIHTDESGTFTFLGVPHGKHVVELAVVASLEGHPPPKIAVSRGETDATFTLDGARTLRLRCEFPEILRRDLDVQVASQDGTHRATGSWSHVDTGGLVTDAKPDRTYDLCVRSPSANLAALVENVDPGGAAFVPLGRAAPVEGRVGFPAAVRPEDVQGTLSRRGLSFPMRLEKDGSFIFPALPAGTDWTLRVEAPTGEILPEVVIAEVVVGLTRSIVVSFE